jgi:hypothetical protein
MCVGLLKALLRVNKLVMDERIEGPLSLKTLHPLIRKDAHWKKRKEKRAASLGGLLAAGNVKPASQLVYLEDVSIQKKRLPMCNTAYRCSQIGLSGPSLP